MKPCLSLSLVASETAHALAFMASFPFLSDIFWLYMHSAPHQSVDSYIFHCYHFTAVSEEWVKVPGLKAKDTCRRKVNEGCGRADA